MLRINIEVTETPTRLKQIEEIAVHNTGLIDDGEHIYDVYRNGKLVASVNHLRANGALMLAHCALDAALDVKGDPT